MSLRFGTDGVRGVAGTELTPELALALGRAAARTLTSGSRSALAVGRDTRWSGPLLHAAFAAGVAAEGVDVVDLGVVPTPAVAAVAARDGIPAAVISASHNPFADNGIKLLAAGGRKLGAAEETRAEAVVEALMARPARPDPAVSGPVDTGPVDTGPVDTGPVDTGGPSSARSGDRLGRIRADPEAREWYCDRVVAALDGRRLGGTGVVLDCANGAATTTAPAIFRAAGAEVVEVVADHPDGRNINDACGSTDPTGLAAAVVRHGAEVGLAFDGDADRVIAVDGRGEVVDGDRLLALFALDLRARGRLAGDTVVVTVMSNLGFHHAMATSGVAVHQTPVGDRHVLEALDAHGWSLGGEQSGHLVFRDLATTGDGALTGLLLLDLVGRAGRPLADLASDVMVRLPQVLRNVAVAGADARAALAASEPIRAEVEAVEAELGSAGRVLVRPSGTEPLVRVMVEAETEDLARSAAERLVSAVAAALGPA